MSLSSSEDGTERLICAAPPGSAPLDFFPSAFAGHAVVTGTPVGAFTYQVGTADFAIELWVRQRTEENFSPDVNVAVGFGSGAWSSGVTFNFRAGFQMWPNGDILTIFNDETNPAVNGPDWINPVETGWRHVVLNFDRNGNLTLYGNAQSRGIPAAMPAATAWAAARNFYPMVHDQENTTGSGVSTYFPASDGVGTYWVIGPMALHTTLLTLAQIRDSWQNHVVQDLGASTQFRTVWRQRGVTSWDSVGANIVGPLDDALTVPFAAPVGASVVVVDESGSGNDWTLPNTASAYSTTNLAQVLFVADPFFR